MAKKALCLSGGGARGSFQMGAVRCLYEVYGFRPDVISGTSVGAVNGIKLAAAPPPVNNDAQAFVTAVNSGQEDAQLKQMRGLEQLWLEFLTPGNFFALRAPFRGTMIEGTVRDLNTPSYTGPMNTEINPDLDVMSALISIPILNLVAGPVIAATKIREIRELIEKVSVENSLLDLSPIEAKLRDPANVNMDDLFAGTPLYLSMVSLETGKLRYVTNKGEFYERDGVTPVATALMDEDVDAALDENGSPLSAARKNTIKSLVAAYKAAVNQITAHRDEYNASSTTTDRRRELSALMQREVDRGNYRSKALKQQISGLKLTAKVDPVVGVLGSACMPVYFDPPVVGVERYVDGGVREIIPVDVVLRHNIDQLVGIVCSAKELPETGSMDKAGLISVAMRSLMDIALEEVVEGDLAAAGAGNIDTRYILPAFNVHDTVVVQPSLIEISMHYGWLRAVDEMQPGSSLQRIDFRKSSELLARLRLKCLELERLVASIDIRLVDAQQRAYSELRVNRWMIMHVSAKRTSYGLPAHPTQSRWPVEWEREFRDSPPIQASSVWSMLEARSIDSSFLAFLLPASSPATFNPDSGTIQDAGSDRLYWLVRGAVFEDKSGNSPAAPFASVVVPNGAHQYLPRIPSGMHIMAESQDPLRVWLVAGGKKYAAPTPQIIAAAGLTGSPVALVPQGGMRQIPEGGVPTFLGSLAAVDQSNHPLAEVLIERLEQSDTIADISLYNRSAARVTAITVVPDGFSSREGVSVQSAPSSMAPNSFDLITLRLKPSRRGEFAGSLLINSSDTLMPSISVPLKIRVLPLGDMASLEFTPNPVEINARVNSTSSYATLVVTNTGTVAPINVTAAIEPAAAQSLFVPGVNINPTAYTPGRSVPMPIFFYPVTAGRFDAELVLTYGGRTSTNRTYQRVVRVPLAGNAGASKIGLSRNVRRPARTPIMSTPILRPPGDLGGIVSARLDPIQNSLNINLGTVRPPMSAATSFFINNTGDLPLTVSNIVTYYASITAGSGLVFPLTIAPGQQLNIVLDLGTYHSPQTGSFSETVRILSDDPVTPEVTVVLTGAVGGANCRINPEFLDFRSVLLGGTGTVSAAFEDTGTMDLHINKISWQSGDNFGLVQTPQLPFTVTAGGSLPLEIRYLSRTPGNYSDRLMVDTVEGISASLGVQAEVT